MFKYCRSHLVILTALLSGLTIFSGCETSRVATANEIPAPVGTASIRSGDIVQISLQSIPQSQIIQQTVDDQGNINLPYIGSITAIGLSESRLASNIRQTYQDSQIYRSVDVSVSVAERYVYVGGEVGRPGRVVWSPDLTLLKAIQSAGGFALYAQRGGVMLSREGQSYTVDARTAQRMPEQDPQLYPGDSITVLRSNL